MVLSVTGRLDFDEVVQLAEKYCGDWPRVDAPREQPEPIYKPQRDHLTDAKLNRQYTMGMTPGPSAQDERRFAARVLADVDRRHRRQPLLLGAGRQRDRRGRRLRLLSARRLRQLLHRRSRPTPSAPNRRWTSRWTELEKVKTRSERRRSRAREEQDRQQPGALSGEVPIGRMRSIGGQWIYNKRIPLARTGHGDADGRHDRLRCGKLMSDFPFDPMTIVSLGPGEK